MSTNPTFAAILGKKSQEVERPKPFPVGTYLCLVQGQPTFDQIGEKKTDCVNFNLTILQPQDDVDRNDLEAMGGVNGKAIRHRLFITEDAAWRLKKFLVEDLAIEEGSKSLGELIPEAPGKQVMVKLRHRTSQDMTQTFHEVADTARV